MEEILNSIWEWIKKNKEWLFSGAGLTLLLFIPKLKSSLNIFKKALRWFGRQIKNIGEKLEGNEKPTIQKAINVSKDISINEDDLNRLKRKVKVTFIDDDSKFKVVNILRNAGWINTQCIPDIQNIDDQVLVDSQIIFVDVQGVGKDLNFKDEGLGLASSIKKRYPRKKVVIYSAITKGERFHEALRIADDSLDKNADAYECLSLVEQYAVELYAS